MFHRFTLLMARVTGGQSTAAGSEKLLKTASIGIL
jgi:hypothetical protein